MCGVIVVEAVMSRSTWHGRDAYIHNRCLGYHHNFVIFYQLLDSYLFTHLLFAFKREASSETYGPGSILHHISLWSTILQSFTFRSINQKPQKYLLYLLFSFIYLYQISLLQVTVKGLTTPLSRRVQVVWLFGHVLVICALYPTGLIPWFSNWGKY